MRHKTSKTIELIAMRMARWVGTPISILIHTILFIFIFVLHLFGVSFENIMLLLTTIVSLEAIYLSLFIQMTVNQHAESLEDVEEDIDNIQENVEGITSDIDDVQEDVENLETNVKGIAADVEDIAEDVETPQAQNISPKKPSEPNIMDTLNRIQHDMQELSQDVKHMKEALHTRN
jgi:peptidoglycan hydrolase CwlO-like protein